VGTCRCVCVCVCVCLHVFAFECVIHLRCVLISRASNHQCAEIAHFSCICAIAKLVNTLPDVMSHLTFLLKYVHFK